MYECKHRDRLMFELSTYAENSKNTNSLYEALDNWKKYGKNMTSNNIASNNKQIGGSHYTSKTIQPWDYIAVNQLGYFEGNIVKYVSRWRDKNGLEDLRKARHYLDKLIELELNK